MLHQQWLTTWSPLHLWQSQFATQDGVQHYPLSAGAFYLLHPLYSPQSLPFTLAPFLFAGIVALWLGRRSGEGSSAAPAPRAILLLLLAWWLVPALYLVGVPFESARFALIYAPPLALLEAVGLAIVLFTLAPRWRGAVRAGILLAVLSLCLLVADARRPLAALSDAKAGDLAAVHGLATYAPHGATLVTLPDTHALPQRQPASAPMEAGRSLCDQPARPEPTGAHLSARSDRQRGEPGTAVARPGTRAITSLVA